jgi:hypothetical protein
MSRLDPAHERLFTGIAHALFMNRLHVLRLTEIVRLRIQPSGEDANMVVPPELDDELKQQAMNFVLTCFPPEFSEVIHRVKADWLRPA